MSTPTILVIEDDLDSRELVAEMLQREGYQVALAEHGRAALDYLGRAEKPALILLDLMMPVMNGWQLAAELHKDENLADIPIIVLSADRDLATSAASIRATAYLKKPLRVPSLLDAIRAQLVPPGERGHVPPLDPG